MVAEIPEDDRIRQSRNNSEKDHNDGRNCQGDSLIVTEEESDIRDKDESKPETAVYSRRFYIMFIFALTSFVQASSWNTWGPITKSAEAVLDWADSDISNMANVGNIAFVVCVIPVCYLMDFKGMRISMLIATFLITLGSVIRCFTLQHGVVTWIALLSATLNGAGGVVPFGGPALISSLWFPLNQRATATAIASFANYLGMAMSFLIGPFFVRSPEYGVINNSAVNGSTPAYFYSTGNATNHTDIINMDDMKTDIFHLMYYFAGFSGGIFLLTLLYFPSKPPKPPSISASKERTEYIQGLKHLVSNGSLWLIVIASSIPLGVLGVWGAIIDIILKPLDVSQSVAGYIGFWQVMGGCLASLVIGRFSDIFMKRMKMFLIICFSGAIASTAWFTLICQQYIPYSIVSVYASAIGIGVFINGCTPLFYELSCEASYPVSEGICGGFLTLVNNLCGILFLMVMLIPNIGNSWQNWALLGSTAIALPMLCVFPERYKRTDLDITISVKSGEVNEDVSTDSQEA